MPVLAVKSFDSSTSAFAGSHAAQHSVNCFCCACAPPLISAAAMKALAAMATLLLFKLILGLLFENNRGHRRDIGGARLVPASTWGHRPYRQRAGLGLEC